jgi:hypothetical protein
VFVIRREQFESLAAAHRRERSRQSVARLRRQFPEKLAADRISDSELERHIDHNLARAALYAIEDDADLASYLDYMVVLGPRFDEDPALPWARRVLERDDLTGSVKMWLLNEHMLFEDGGPR